MKYTQEQLGNIQFESDDINFFQTCVGGMGDTILHNLSQYENKSYEEISEFIVEELPEKLTEIVNSGNERQFDLDKILESEHSDDMFNLINTIVYKHVNGVYPNITEAVERLEEEGY